MVEFLGRIVLEDILILIIGLVVVCFCFIFPKKYSDSYMERYGCGISYPVSIFFAVAMCWYLIDMESKDAMHVVSLIVLIIASLIMIGRLILEYKRKEVSTQDKILFTICQILFSVGSFVLIVLLLVWLLSQGNAGKKKRR